MLINRSENWQGRVGVDYQDQTTEGHIFMYGMYFAVQVMDVQLEIEDGKVLYGSKKYLVTPKQGVKANWIKAKYLITDLNSLL